MAVPRRGGYGMPALLTASLLLTVARDAATGWTIDSGMQTVGPPAVWEEGQLLVFQAKTGTSITKLFSSDAATGTVHRCIISAFNVSSNRMVPMIIVRDMKPKIGPGEPVPPPGMSPEGIVFFAGYGNTFSALRSTTLDPIWEFSIDGANQVTSSAIDTYYDAFTVYVVMRVGRESRMFALPVYPDEEMLTAAPPGRHALDPLRDAPLVTPFWNVSLPGVGNATAPVVIATQGSEELLAVVVTDARVVAHSSVDGSLRWSYPFSGVSRVVDNEAPAAGLGKDSDGNATAVVFFLVSLGEEPSHHKVYALSETGEKLWEYHDDKVGHASSVAYSSVSGVVIYSFFADDEGSYVTAVNATTGYLMWCMSDPHNSAHLSRPRIHSSGLAYVTATTSRSLDLWAVTSLTGEFYWSDPVVGPTNCTYPSDNDGLSSVTKICDTTNPPYTIAIDGDTGYVPGIDGTMYSVTLPTQAPDTPAPSPGSSTIPAYVFYTAAGCGALALVVLLCLPRLVCSKKSGYSRLSVTHHYDEAIANLQKKKKEHESRYTAIRKLGHGAFGEVYEVRCKKDGKHYALKRIPCDNEFERNEAVREWRMLCEIDHPNKITAYETFMNWATQPVQQKDGHINQPSKGNRDSAELDIAVRRYVCIIMEYCPGGDLKRLVSHYKRDNEAIPESTILNYCAQICSLLSVLHAQTPPLVHRDLKPENVLLRDNNKRVVVTDFGLARLVSAGDYLVSHAGTVAYIAPETWDRHYSTGADVWALGCIIYAMCSRRVSKTDVRVLWRESTKPGFQKEIEDEIAGELGYSRELGHIAAQLLTPERKDRPNAATAYSWLKDYYPSDLCTKGDTADYGTTAEPQKRVSATAAAAPSTTTPTSSPNTPSAQATQKTPHATRRSKFDNIPTAAPVNRSPSNRGSRDGSQNGHTPREG